MNLIAFLCAGMATVTVGVAVFALVVIARDRRAERRKHDRRRARPKTDRELLERYREACRDCGIDCDY